MLHRFIDIPSCNINHSAIPVDQTKLVAPGLSQVSDLIIRPFGAPFPTDWTDYETVESIVDNAVTDNTKAKWFAGIGELPNPAESLRRLGKVGRKIGARTYTLSFTPSLLCGTTMDLLDDLQTGWNKFSFWYRCWGGAAFGGANGIKPILVNVRRPLGGDPTSFQQAEILLTWVANGDPTLSNWSDFSPGVPAVSESTPSAPPIIGDPDSGIGLGGDGDQVLGGD